MIVITTLDTEEYRVMAGDKFQLTVRYSLLNESVVIEEPILKAGIVNFCASFRFAHDDGTCVGNHFCGIFAKQDELPEEIKNAKMMEDLSLEQQDNFFKTVNVKIQG